MLEWEDAGQIAGFYTLSALSVGLGELPAEVSRRLPRYPEVPATLIGRLAVDSRHRGRGYGELLLMDALRRILDSTVDVASVAAVVDAKDEGAAAFYRRYGFTTFPKRPGRLFLPVATIRRMFE